MAMLGIIANTTYRTARLKNEGKLLRFIYS